MRFLFYTLLKELLYYNERGYRIKKSDSPKVCHPEQSEGSYSAIVYLYYTYHVQYNGKCVLFRFFGKASE